MVWFKLNFDLRETWNTPFMIMVSSKQIFSDKGQTHSLGESLFLSICFFFGRWRWLNWNLKSQINLIKRLLFDPGFNYWIAIVLFRFKLDDELKYLPEAQELIRPERNTLTISFQDVETYKSELATIIQEEYYR